MVDSLIYFCIQVGDARGLVASRTFHSGVRKQRKWKANITLVILCKQHWLLGPKGPGRSLGSPAGGGRGRAAPSADGSVSAGVLALWVLVTHVMYMQDYWRTWLKGLRGFFFVGVLFSAVSVATFCTFLVLAVTRHQSEGGQGRAWEGPWGI